MSQSVADATHDYVQKLMAREWQTKLSLDSRAQFVVSLTSILLSLSLTVARFVDSGDSGFEYEEYEALIVGSSIALGVSAVLSIVTLFPWNYPGAKPASLAAWLDERSIGDQNPSEIARVYEKEIAELEKVRCLNNIRAIILGLALLAFCVAAILLTILSASALSEA